MLNLDGSVGAVFYIGTDVEVKIRDIDLTQGTVTLGFQAPPEVCIDRASVRTRRIESVAALRKPE